MAQYRKKPVVVDAWDSTNLVTLRGVEGVLVNMETTPATVYDYLHDTWVKFEPGDFIIRGVQGEFYPCKRDVFAATYEAI